MTQKEVFIAGEGDEWFERNRASLSANNPAVELLKQIELLPKKILEVGCSNGFQLNRFREEFGCECFGVDPSPKAISDGLARFPGLNLATGTAENLQYEDGSFDTVILGFCLYLCDRKDLFKIACEANRVLQDKGTLAITDFCPPFPFKNRYSHCEGIYAYKMDYSKMFLWNPAYSEVAKFVYSHSGYELRDNPDERIATIILRKSEQGAFVEGPYSR